MIILKGKYYIENWINLQLRGDEQFRLSLSGYSNEELGLA